VAVRAQTCQVSAQAPAFGTYVASNSGADTSTGNVQVTCSALFSLFVSYTISLSAGASGNVVARSMVGSRAGTLGYQLYTSAQDNQVWGDGSGGSATVTDSYLLQLLSPIVRNYPVYGKVPPGQYASPGSYTDTIAVVLTY
jgi:spore coat protein U-like protein